jgi:hypothetical protein
MDAPRCDAFELGDGKQPPPVGDEKRIIPNGRLRLLSTYCWLSRRAMFAEVDLDHQDPVMTSHLRAREDCTHQQA